MRCYCFRALNAAQGFGDRMPSVWTDRLWLLTNVKCGQDYEHRTGMGNQCIKRLRCFSLCRPKGQRERERERETLGGNSEPYIQTEEKKIFKGEKNKIK